MEATGKAYTIRGNFAGIAFLILIIKQKLFNFRDILSLLLGNYTGKFPHITNKLQAFFLGIPNVKHVIAACGFLCPGNQRGVKPPRKGDPRASPFRDGNDGFIDG
ncbi:hypothetical protein ACF8NH_15180 [Providencia sp. TYF_10]|uniref:hypothetical protein n=1 Tax=Providencia sp. TYF_10 TaxID=3367190 RepID=UPI00370BED1B